MILVFLLAALMASTYTFGKAALMYTSPIFLVGFRLVIAGLIFGTYFVCMRFAVPSFDRRAYWLFAQLIACSFYGGFILEFMALNKLTSIKTAFLYCLSPIVSAFFSYFMFHEKMTFKKVLGLVIALSGFIPLLISTSPSEGATLLYISLPEIILFMAVCVFAYGLIVARALFTQYNPAVSFINGTGMFIGGTAAVLTSYLFEIPHMTNRAAWTISWLPITNIPAFLCFALPLILIGNVICYLLYVYLLKRYTVTVVTFVELTTPLFAAVYGFLFLHEHITWIFFPSLALLLLGMYIYYKEEARLGYI